MIRQFPRFLRRVRRTVARCRGLGEKCKALLCTAAYAAEFAGIRTKPRTLCLRMGDVTIHVNTARRDIVGFWEVWVDQTYQPTDEFRPRLGETLVDVGANVGFNALYHALSAPQTRVLALEPDPATFALLERNVSSNSAAAVNCFNLAAGDIDGQVWFLSERLSLNSRVVSPHTPGAIHVPCVTLDLFVREQGLERIDTLKIDCEGWEPAVLRGARQVALPMTRRVVMEVHSDQDRGEVQRILKELEFSLVHENGNELFFARRGTPVPERSTFLVS